MFTPSFKNLNLIKTLSKASHNYINIIIWIRLHTEPIVLNFRNNWLISNHLFSTFFFFCIFFIIIISLFFFFFRLNFQMAKHIKIFFFWITSWRQNKVCTFNFFYFVIRNWFWILEKYGHIKKRFSSSLRRSWLTSGFIKIHCHNLLHIT